MPSHQATNPPSTRARKKKEEPPLKDPRAGLDRLKDFTRKIMAVPKEEAEPPKKKPT
jgi:hypothetical protein